MSKGKIRLQKVLNKDQRKLIEYVEAKGWTIKSTRSGWMALSPDGVSKVTMHASSSDHRAFENMKKDFKRAGLDMEDF